MTHHPESSHTCCEDHANDEHDLLAGHGESRVHAHGMQCTHHHVDVEATSGPRLLIKASSAGKRSLVKKPIAFWVRLILGAIFVFASFDKAIHPADFAQAVYNYQILPDSWINLTAIILPWVELVLGILLILGLWLPGAVLLTNLLLVAFFGALLFNIARGLNVHCGCFSTSTEGDPATTWYLIRDSSFLILGGYLFYEELWVKR